MVPSKSLDDSKIIAALLHDVFTSCGTVFNTSARRNTLTKVLRRTEQEGLGFLTKTLPRLGKAFDKALAGGPRLNAVELRFTPMPDSQLPKLFGELFSRVFQPDGALLPVPCEQSVEVIRQILFVYYKYELPYTVEQEQQVIDRFVKTEDDLSSVNCRLEELESTLNKTTHNRSLRFKTDSQVKVAREARRLLSDVFSRFDPKDIAPRHGPGAVATKQQLWEKYVWTNVSAKITDKYPLDEYFYASLGHVCDSFNGMNAIEEKSLPARVILVPKDSRGPRLISCEPVDYQWIQQGLGGAIVELLEHHPLTMDNVFFTDQQPNRNGARIGSIEGKYATLDLNEASDRVSVGLVRLLYPAHIYEYLMACRSSSTVLPDGKEIELKKFAPMGSCLCFPIMALTIWSILTSAAPDAYTRERIYVYGDDVIVPTAYAVDAMEQLESFGLKINRDKSCISGLFRESCGMDAFKGKDVTPVRLRTVWSSTRSPGSYTSWVAYANSFYSRGYYNVYDCIVEHLCHLYGGIPTKDMALPCPSLIAVSEHQRPIRHRSNKKLQKLQYLVWDVKSVAVNHVLDGWSQLLRYFAEKANSRNNKNDREAIRNASLNHEVPSTRIGSPSFDEDHDVFSSSIYTRRRASMLVRRWR